MIIFNIEEDPIATKHICYFTKRAMYNNREYIFLYEVKEYIYVHPQSEGNSSISKVDHEVLYHFDITTELAAPLLLLENAQINISLCLKKMDETIKKITETISNIFLDDGDDEIEY